MKRTLTIREAAEMMGLSPACVEKALKNGDIPARRIGGRWAIPRRAIEVYLDTGTWPKPNPDIEELAELIVVKLQRIRQAGLEATIAAESAAADNYDDRKAVLVSLKKAS